MASVIDLLISCYFASATTRWSVLCDDSPLIVDASLSQDLCSVVCCDWTGVTAIEPDWLPLFVPTLCHNQVPLSQSDNSILPRFDNERGLVVRHVTCSFGKLLKLLFLL